MVIIGCRRARTRRVSAPSGDADCGGKEVVMD